MIKKLKIIVFGPLFALVFFTLLFEIGFGLRDIMSYLSYRSEAAPGQKKILFLGDSILGFTDSKNSLAENVVREFNLRFPGSYHFKDFSLIQSLRTHQVLGRINQTLLQYQPDAVVIMVGKSDLRLNSQSHSQIMASTRLFRYLEKAFWVARSELFFDKNSLQNMQRAWELHSEEHCLEAIPYFKAAIAEFPKTERLLRGLHRCFIATNSLDEGIKYFSELEKSSPHAALAREYVSIYQAISSEELSSQILSTRQAFKAKSRDMVRSNMWLYGQAKRFDLLSKEFLEMPLELDDVLTQRSANYLKEIIKVIEQSSAKTFVLQYPLDHLETLEKSLGNNFQNLTYIELRAYLEKLSPDELKDIWSDDIEHLSPIGASFLAKKIVDEISKKIEE